MIDATLGAVPRLKFGVRGVEAANDSATPALRMRFHIGAEAGASVLGLALNVDVRIAAERRRYDEAERSKMRELFGDATQWDRSIGPIAWTRGTLNVPAFGGSTEAVVTLPCGYDFDLVAVKYASALDGGFIPIEVLLTGTVFYRSGDRMLAAKLPWDSEIGYRVDVATWQAAVGMVFGDEAWLRIDRNLLRRLQDLRSQRGFTTWNQTIESLLDGNRT
ncbi:MAG TPA: DUF6084 family protein [Candidatus Tumulicola sp.]